MNYLWKLLLLLLCPAVDEEDLAPEDDETPPEDDETPPEDDETPPEDDETPPEDDEDEPAPRETRGQKAIRELRERSQTAEAQLAEAKRQLAEASRQSQPAAQPSQSQQMFEQEEAALRNPDTSDWQRYAIQSAREARAANANSQNALRQAADLADRTRFEQLKASKPKMFEKYAPKVEELLKEMRSKGNDAPRDELLALLLGRDMRDGKLTTSKKSAKPNGGAERGKTPGARSTVPSSGGRMTDSEKRAKRLENVRI